MLVSEVPGILRVEWNSEGNTMVQHLDKVLNYS